MLVSGFEYNQNRTKDSANNFETDMRRVRATSLTRNVRNSPPGPHQKRWMSERRPSKSGKILCPRTGASGAAKEYGTSEEKKAADASYADYTDTERGIVGTKASGLSEASTTSATKGQKACPFSIIKG